MLGRFKLLVRSTTVWIGQVANCAGAQRTGMTLQVDTFDRIAWLSAGGDSMGASAAYLTILYVTVTRGQNRTKRLIITVGGRNPNLNKLEISDKISTRCYPPRERGSAGKLWSDDVEVKDDPNLVGG